MKHIKNSETARGFKSYILQDGTGESLIVTESSNAERPMVLIKSTNLPSYLNREQVSELITILTDFVENKGEYFYAWEDTKKEFKKDLEKLLYHKENLGNSNDIERLELFCERKDLFIQKWEPE